MANMQRTGSGVVVSPNVVTDEVAVAKSNLDQMRDYFANMDKVEIRIPKDRGEQFVQVNGYTFAIAPGVTVRVPVQIADMLRDAGII